MKRTNESIHYEQRVLENLMHFGDYKHERVQNAFLKLSPDCFYNPLNAIIYGMIRDNFASEQPFTLVDILIACQGNDELHNHMTWIISNYREMHVSDNTFESDVLQIIKLSQLRKQIYLAKRMIAEVESCPTPTEAHSILTEKLEAITRLNYQESKHGVTTVEIAEAYLDGLLSDDVIIPTECHQLNVALNGGVMSKSLITVAAGAGVGKTGFAIYLMDAIARNEPGKQSLFFSLEMGAKHIWQRLVGIRGGKQFDKLSIDERRKAITASLEIPIKIYDSSSCPSASDIDFILTTARLKSIEKPLSVIVIDYLGLVENRGQFERNDLKQSDITTKLAKLAMELNCIVIALSQINRAASSRAIDDRCPFPSDAADSSGSHRSSTLWLGVDRPELYNSDPSALNQFVIKCRKNRFGGTFEIILAFNDGTFAEVQPGHFKKPFAKKTSAEAKIFGDS